MQTAYQMVWMAAQRTPTHLALVDDQSDRRLNYSDMIIEVDVIAAGMLERGIRKGDKVVPGTAVAEIISEGYFTLLSEVEGVVKEFYVQEGEYVEIDTAIIEIELAEPE